MSGGDRRADEASTGIKLLGHIRDLFEDERMSCASLVEALNAEEELPYGGWSDGRGINARELGRKLTPYGIRAHKIRFDERTLNGYRRFQFEDAWSRYLPDSALDIGTPEQMAQPSQKQPENKPEHEADVPMSKNAANPHEQRDVPVVPMTKPEIGTAAAADDFDAAEFIREQRKGDALERAHRFDEMFPPKGRA